MTVEMKVPAKAAEGGWPRIVPEHVDLVEWYYRQGCSDGLPVVPPTPVKVAAVV